MPVSRTTLLEGPAVVIHDGVTYYSAGKIVYSPGISTFGIDTSIHGKLSDRFDDQVGTVRFTPVGRWGAYFGKLVAPFGSAACGSSIFGATDKPLVIHSLAGRTLTLNCAGVSRPPKLTFSAGAPIFGEVEFTVIGSNDTAWSGANSRYTEAAAAFSAAGFDPADILTQPYAVSVGNGASWQGIETAAGVTVEISPELTPIKVDSSGTIDLRIARVSCEARFVPVGPTAAEYLARLLLQGSGAGRGAELGGGGAALSIAGDGVSFEIPCAAASDGSQHYDTSAFRHGEITFKALRAWDDEHDELLPLFTAGDGE